MTASRTSPGLAVGRQATAESDLSPVLVAATTNANKIREMEPILRPALAALGLELRSLAGLGPAGRPRPDRHAPGAATVVREDRETFAGNAALKALAAAGLGFVALGEDSGLCVDALGGDPGVRSARYSGRGTAENNLLLLQRLQGVPPERRGARFTTAAVVKVPGGPLYAGEGRVEGDILTEPRGEGGFGYDPVFRSREFGRSFAEVSLEQKARVSHRTRALRAVRGYLFEAFAGRGSARGGDAVPSHAAALEALRDAGCPEGLLAHSLAVGRVSREMALLLAEAGRPVSPALAAAAGLLHDLGRCLPGPGESAGEPGRRPPPGVVDHAWRSAVWAADRGLPAALVRAVMIHGLDSLVSDDYRPVSWEEKIVMLSDKLVERRFIGLEARLSGLERRHPGLGPLVTRCRPALYALESEVAAACGLSVGELRQDLEACLHVAILPDGAGADDVERAMAALRHGDAGPTDPGS